MQLGFKRVHPNAKIPTYAHVGDSGMDVYAVEDTRLEPFKPTLVRTGLIADIPMGYEIQVRPRSGLALKQQITVFNTPGTVDAGYRAEIGVILVWNPYTCVFYTVMNNLLTAIYKYFPQGKDEDFVRIIHKGERIAQFVVAPVTRVEPIEVTEVSETERNKGGFGSTGK